MRLALPLLLLVSMNVSAAPPDFAKDVRPILANHCFKCHGPDSAARKAKLRLNTADGAKAALNEVKNRIVSRDDDEVMPPPHVKKPLTEKQIQILNDWIAAGAKYEQHWSFVAPKRPAIPPFSREAKPGADAARVLTQLPDPATDRHGSVVGPIRPGGKGGTVGTAGASLTPRPGGLFCRTVKPELGFAKRRQLPPEGRACVPSRRPGVRRWTG